MKARARVAFAPTVFFFLFLTACSAPTGVRDISAEDLLARPAADTLSAAGFPSLLHLDGDMSAWREAGRPMAE